MNVPSSLSFFSSLLFSCLFLYALAISLCTRLSLLFSSLLFSSLLFSSLLFSSLLFSSLLFSSLISSMSPLLFSILSLLSSPSPQATPRAAVSLRALSLWTAESPELVFSTDEQNMLGVLRSFYNQPFSYAEKKKCTNSVTFNEMPRTQNNVKTVNKIQACKKKAREYS